MISLLASKSVTFEGGIDKFKLNSGTEAHFYGYIRMKEGLHTRNHLLSGEIIVPEPYWGLLTNPVAILFLMLFADYKDETIWIGYDIEQHISKNSNG